MADIKAILAELQGGLAKANDFQKEGKKVLAELGTLKKDLESFKLDEPDLKKKGWLKQCESLGADKGVLQAVKAIEAQSSRDSCEAAYKLMKDDKKLKKVADEILAVLRADEKIAQGLAKTLSEVKAAVAESQKLETASKDVEPNYTKLTKAIVVMVKEMREAKAA